jgi:hypothetical protein
LVVERDRLLPGTRRGVVLVQPFLKIVLASGIGKPPGCLLCLVDGGIGCALPLIAHREEVAIRVDIIRHPQGHVAGGLVAGHDALAPVRGHAKAEARRLLKGFEMGPPGLRRAIRGQLDVEKRRALRVNGDQNGRVDGENCIAERKPQLL